VRERCRLLRFVTLLLLCVQVGQQGSTLAGSLSQRQDLLVFAERNVGD
jgi:hypothetical protein